MAEARGGEWLLGGGRRRCISEECWRIWRRSSVEKYFLIVMQVSFVLKVIETGQTISSYSSRAIRRG